MLTLNPNGLYCEAGDFYIDPWRGVSRAVITHAHSDHARFGSERYLSHHLTTPVLKHRLGENLSVQSLEYNESTTINGVMVSLHPAGHIPGSSQVRIEHRGEVWVVTGDYKLEHDGISTPFEPVQCDTFISECTFGLPIYRWEAQQEVFRQIDSWWRENKAAGRASVLTCYSLGKAQRILANVNRDIGEVFAHGAIVYTTEVLRRAGLPLPSLTKVSREIERDRYPGSLILVPPSVIGTSWMNRLEPASVATASGWMLIRGMKKRRGGDRGFVLSDHADFPGLLSAIKESGASRVLLTHGYTAPLARYLNETGYSAGELKTEFLGEGE